ncbi:MAG: CAP domain-containing protein [Actinomycetota bacterium]|nr:CAP domain-containing protein [Actinomycetota bacterium]
MRPRGVLPFIAMMLFTMMLVAGPTTVAHASTRTANRNLLLKLINRSRVHHGLRELKLSATTSDYAYRHSRDMCDADTLFHSTTLTSRITSTTSASYWGENIAFASTLRQIRKMWMHSAPHRENILNRHYRRAGVGVYDGRGYLWATVDFYG